MSALLAVPRVGTPELDRLVDAVSAADWQALAGSRVFITGGSGFVGVWLLELLLRAQERLQLGLVVTVLTRRPAAFAQRLPHLAAHPSVLVLTGDVAQLQEVSTRFDFCVHAGANASPAPGEAVATFDELLGGTRQVCELATRAGCRRLLNLSSGAVYGLQPPDLPLVGEQHPSAPWQGDGAAYGLGKLASEWLATQMAEAGRFGVVHARVFAMLGPHIPLQRRFAAGQFLADAAASRPIRVASSGAAVRSYLYAGDVAVWLLTLLVRGQHARAYNVGSEEPVSVLALAEQIGHLAGVAVEVADRSPQTGLPPRYVPDTALARQALGLRPLTPWAATLAASWAWVRELYALEAAPRSAT